MALTFVNLSILLLATVSLASANIQPLKWSVPHHKPGDILNTTDHSKIEEALQELDDIPSRVIYTKTLSIGFSSVHGTLVNPKNTLKDGTSWSTIPYTLLAGQTSLHLFSKYYLGVKGVYGVVTYDIQNTELMVAVMFSVPFDQVFRTNMFNFKAFKKTTPVNSDMIVHMYEYAGAWKAKGYETKEEYGIKILGTMSNANHAHLILTVDTSGYDILKPPHRNADCEYRVSAFGSRCWRECNPTGWCWTKTKCDTKNDCNGQTLFCDDSCNQV